jgi:hypothetical protein
VRIHVGVEADIRPERAGLDVHWSDEIPGTVRCHVDDPFGNRIELIEAGE